jgi:hypothetical protein
MNRFERSWLLFKSSVTVINRNKELLIFPLFTAIATSVILLFFIVPAALWPTGQSYTSPEHWKTLWHMFITNTSSASDGQNASFSPIAIGYGVFLYFVSMFFATFFNVAFYHEIMAALNGESVSLGRGLSFAASRWQAILMWTVFAGLIGLIIRAIEERFDVVGRIIAGLLGMAWSIASVFVIPVIVHDQDSVNPISVLKKSAGILRQTWGESLIGYIGMGTINSIVFIGSAMGLAGAAAISSQLHSFWILGIAVALWIVLMLVWSYLMNVANLVYKGALYLYAADGVIADPYSQELLDSAWRFKR